MLTLGRAARVLGEHQRARELFHLAGRLVEYLVEFEGSEGLKEEARVESANSLSR